MVSGRRDAARRRARRCRRQDRRGHQHRRRGPAGPRRRAGDGRRGEPDAIVDVATLTGPCIVALGDKVAGVFGDDDDHAPRSRRRRGERRDALAAADPRRDARGGAHREQDRRPAPAQLGALGIGAVRGRVPRGVRRRQAVGPPRHRGAGVQRAAGRGGTCPAGAPATRSPRSWSTSGGSARSDRGRRGWTGSGALGACCFCRRLYSRIRDGMPTSAASYDGTPLRLAKSWAHFTDGTRRRVHSPSCATSSRVTSVTVVRGSTNPSTPATGWMNSCRWRWSALSPPAPWPHRRCGCGGALDGSDRADPWSKCAASELPPPHTFPHLLAGRRDRGGWMKIHNSR